MDIRIVCKLHDEELRIESTVSYDDKFKIYVSQCGACEDECYAAGYKDCELEQEAENEV